MTDRVLEGSYEQAQHAERYFESMEQAVEFCRWISPSALAINPINVMGEEWYQLVYQWKDSDR